MQLLPLFPMKVTWDITGLRNEPPRKLRFALNIIQVIAELQPERQFSLVYHQETRLQDHLPRNLTLFSTQPPKNRFLLKLWYRIHLLKILQKNNSPMLVSFNRHPNISLPVRQILINWNDENSKVFVGTVFSGLQNSKSGKLRKSNVETSVDGSSIQPAADPAYQPVDVSEATIIKNQWAQGKEYFFCKNRITVKKEFIFLLKAFSLFKKRQKSAFGLLVHVKHPVTFEQLLSTYKYRSDIFLLESKKAEDISRVCAAAYGVVLTDASPDTVSDVLEAMQCRVPVIVPLFPELTDMAGDAVLNFETGSDVSLGENLMRLYTDENRRSQLISRGAVISGNYSLKKNADAIWQAVLNQIA